MEPSALIEVLDDEGRVVQTLPVAHWPVTVRVRLAGESSTPEGSRSGRAERARSLLTLAGTFALLLWLAATLWLDNLPGSGWDNYAPAFLAAIFGLALWSSLWGLGSKLFQHHFRAMPHLRVLLAFLLALLVLDALLALASFALSLPWLSHIRPAIRLGFVAALLAAHVSQLLPRRRAMVAVTFAALWVVAVGFQAALNWRHHQRVFSELYAATLPPPALRVVRPEPVPRLIDDLRPLKARLQQQAREDTENDVQRFGGAGW